MVSEQNSKFAPAGYGLGEAGGKKLTSADNINNIFSNGFYSWYDSAPVNAPSPYMVMVVYSSYFGNIVQEFYRLDMGKYSKCCRYYDNGTWEELEWVNPPMALGIEYRTTERWLGKPVYTMLLDFGALPNATSKTIYITVPVGGAKIEVFSVCGKFSGSDGSNGELLAFDRVRSHWATCTTNAITLGITTSEDATGYNAWITIKYTKD